MYPDAPDGTIVYYTYMNGLNFMINVTKYTICGAYGVYISPEVTPSIKLLESPNFWDGEKSSLVFPK